MRVYRAKRSLPFADYVAGCAAFSILGLVLGAAAYFA